VTNTSKSGQYPSAVVVNDDPTQLVLLAGLLEKEELEVYTYLNAEAALQAMGERPAPDLIVTDLYMPGIDGWHLCRLLRSAEYAVFNEVPIMVVSATFAGDEASRITADIGANAFMSAPVDGRRFIAQVRALLAGEPASDTLHALIVEDDVAHTARLTNAFTAKGYEVDIASTATEGLELLAQKLFNVAVIDFHLTDAPGDILLGEFQAQQPDCVCILMTRDAQPGMVLTWLKTGAAAYVQRPFDPQYLLELCARARRERALLWVEDILKKRTAELRESETMLRTIIETAHVIILVLDNEGRIVRFNRHMEEITGYRLEEVLGKDWFSTFLTEGDRDSTRERFGQSVHGVQTRGNVQVLISKNGRPILVEWYERVLQDDDGNPIGLLAVGQDVTEKALFQQTLSQERNRLDMIIQGTRAGTWEWNLDTDVTVFNERWAEMLGYSLEELQPTTLKTWADLCHPDDLGRAQELLALHLSGESEHYEFEGRLRHKDGHWVWILDRGRVVDWAEDGAPRLMAGIHLDVTERRREIEEQARMQDALYEARKMEAIGQLAHGIAHDFNNMLTSINGYAELIQFDLPEDHPVHPMAGNILDAGNRAAAEVSQLLTFSRQQMPAARVVDVAATLQGVVETLRGQLKDGITLDFSMSEDLGTIKADTERVRQIVINLADQAQAWMPKGGRLTISAENVDGKSGMSGGAGKGHHREYVCIRVSDTGASLSQDVHKRVFEPFFFKSDDVADGVGLRLAVAYGIAKFYQGQIWMESPAEGGNTVSVCLPRHVPENGPKK
jgi:two-component system, cell cycle sensor histidine kinase and response regulator CckA